MRKRIKKLRQIDEELSQGIVRALFAMIVEAYLIGAHYISGIYSETIIAAVGIFFVYSLFNLYHVATNPGNHPLRRILNIVGDIGILSFVLYNAGTTHAIVLYPLLLWMIVGHGMRFGTAYLFMALGTAVIFFTSALIFNPAWDAHRDLVYSLSIGLVVLSLFYAKLIERMHYMNRTLEQKVAERVAEAEHRFLHDSLTELKNRNALDNDLKSKPFSALLVLDIDSFHNYNELYGTEVGDMVLAGMAIQLSRFCREKSYEVYRIYGDHFVLRSTRTHAGHMIVEADVEALFEMLSGWRMYVAQIDDELEIDMTVGISMERENALKKAEMALKHAKKTKKKVIAYSRAIDSAVHSQELLNWKNEIKKAVAGDNIIPVFQGIVNRDQKIVKYESLMRLRRMIGEEEELISPFFFLDIAIKSKLYSRLTQAMVEKTFPLIKENGRDFSINLSFDDIVDPATGALLKEQILKHGVGKQLILEIVESENIDDFNLVKAFIKKFRELGVRIAIDDFGSGYSNYTHIFEIKPDYLKIDGSLIKNIDQDNNSYELVKSITQLAKSLGIETIAEFVSTREIFEICFDLGVDYFQGYYFAEPCKKECVSQYQKELEAVTG